MQGTLNGYGERTGNADLVSVVANLELKLGRPVLPSGSLREATRIAHAVAEVTNVPPSARQPYVGVSAFAHKAGLHASAIKVDPNLYQHMDPKHVGNDMRMLVSDMAGRASIELKSRELGFDLDPTDEEDRSTLARVLKTVKERELRGYTFDAADASFELLLGGQARPGDALRWAALATPALLLVHGAVWLLIRRWRAEGRLTPNVVVVGATRNASRLIEAALKTRDVNVLGVFDDRLARAPADLHGVPVLGDTRALVEHPVLPYVDRIVITVSASAQERVRALIDRLKVVPNAIILFLDVEGEREQAQTLSRLTDQPLAQVSGRREDERRAAAKRVQDVVVSGLGLLAAAPLMALIAMAVRLDGGGPVLFRQRRYGFNNEPITVLKFRTMRTEAADPRSVRQVQAGDPRVTRVGRFLRRTSLDELPQLLNVWSGEMSMVGPRPHPIGMKTAGEDSHRLVAEYAWRHRMKPGLTGWAQINGSRGPVDTPEAVRRRVALDLDYIERQSLMLDLYVMLMTAPRLLGDRAAVR